MIGHLRGALLEKHPNLVLLEAGGVGYEVSIPVSTYTVLPEPGAQVSLRIHTHVREDAIQLYGFAAAAEKALFERLISVSGIGPKLAITILSGLAAAELAEAIRAGSLERLVRIPGVGKKTAERMVLELRDKLDLAAVPAAAAKTAPAVPLDEAAQDAVSALVNMGSKPAAAEEAVRKARAAEPEAGFEALFRKALALVR
jgi:Holliday junction DNA helicase RuvA